MHIDVMMDFELNKTNTQVTHRYGEFLIGEPHQSSANKFYSQQFGYTRSRERNCSTKLVYNY
jgi:hypothetical protein